MTRKWYKKNRHADSANAAYWNRIDRCGSPCGLGDSRVGSIDHASYGPRQHHCLLHPGHLGRHVFLSKCCYE